MPHSRCDHYSRAAHIILFSVLVIIAFVAGASLTPAKAADSDKFSGFLTNYSSLKPGPEGGAKLLWQNPNYKWPDHIRAFNAIYIDSIKVMLSKKGQGRGVDAKELAQLSKEFHAALINSVKDGYQVAPAPGPGVLRLVVALTDVEPSDTTMDTVTTVVPTARVFSFLKKQVTGKNSFVGSASVEGVLLDGGSGETLAAFVDSRPGSKGIGGVTDEYNDAKEAFEAWGKRLRYVLDTAHGRTKK